MRLYTLVIDCAFLFIASPMTQNKTRMFAHYDDAITSRNQMYIRDAVNYKVTA